MPRLQLKGINLTPRRDSFDPIETASRDEIGALQLKRLKWTLNHAYSNVAHYKKAFDKAGAHPDDLKSLDDLRIFPSPPKTIYAATTLSACSPFRANKCCACMLRRARPASLRSLAIAARSRHVG